MMSEIEMLWTRAHTGDQDSVNQLIAAIWPSVDIIAMSIRKSKEFSKLPLDLDDMTQEGLIALTRAIQKYQPEKGIQFWTYAETVVRNAITDYIRKIMSEYEVWVNILSLNASISDDDSEERSFEETIPDEHSKTPEQIYIEKENLSEIHDALNRISARERDYLCYRFGFDDDEYHDKTETAKHFMMSKSWAGKLEKSALDNFSLELPWWY